ncbi:MAG TPA: NAD(P)-dependent alcohol dehydrogenase [Thermoanaerobaculia bacterium]|jgi:NADPH:quinone reductase-like Zn-dependent oxidoreductase|nr:NAD(P)-dependent alcohol dehydrogenase [Thermoanaerobaculia bacterium]
MRAITYSRFGAPEEVLRCEERPQPTPGDDELLIAVRAAAVNPLDWHFVRGTPYLARMAFGLRQPRNPWLGVDAAGVVEAVGRNVTAFQPGDEVFGNCRGAFAEYALSKESAVVGKPASVAFEQAAAAPVAGYTALQALRHRGSIQPGQRVLVNGAAGGVGTFAVQIAKSFGAEVTGVCSTRNVDLVRSLGADRVVDYSAEDFTRDAARYDLILDCIGNHSLADCRRVLQPSGRYVQVGGQGSAWLGPFPRAIAILLLSPFVKQPLALMLAKGTRDDLIALRDLMAAGTVKPVIDRRYALREVPAAVAYVEAGHARGKVIVTP